YMAESARERENLDWETWAGRLQEYFSLVEFLFSPTLIIVGGGGSKHHRKFLPRLDLHTPIVPAELRNEAGIVGAAALARRAEEATAALRRRPRTATGSVPPVPTGGARPAQTDPASTKAPAARPGRGAQPGRDRGSGGARPPGRGGEGRPAPATAHRHRGLPAGPHRRGHTREEGPLRQEGPPPEEEEKEEGPQGAREGRDEEDRGAGEVRGHGGGEVACAERWADQPACKPGSVIGSHPSRITVAGDLQRSTRELGLAPSSVPCLTLLPVGF